ncbi:MAG TPA: oligosaccharide flippase family protein, partial [Candidatus Acidoferrum sp.]|nr:oligosaccharide flippase family protein [Candidatus Acidoferrum sp.]
MNSLDRVSRASALNRLTSDRLLRQNAIYLTGTLVAGGLGYVFHFVAGRMLGPAQYGVVAAAVAALYLLNLPALIVQTVSARFTSVAAGRGLRGNIPGLVFQLSALGLMVGAVICIALLIASGPLSSYLQIADRRVIAVLALASLVALLVSTARGALQGLQRFVALSINVSVDMVTRLASLVGLVLAGLGALGGVVALVAGPAFAYAQSLFLFRGMGEAQPAHRASIAQLGRYAALATAGAIGTTYLYNIDVLLSKHYLVASSAGIYAAASVLGR